MGVTDIAKELGALWKTIGEKEKSKFEVRGVGRVPRAGSPVSQPRPGLAGATAALKLWSECRA
jgi:hypothetical protein